MPIVFVTRWNGKQQDEFVKITKSILLAVIGRDIVLSVPHGNKVAPDDDGNFHIFIWATSTKNRKDREPIVPGRMYGIRVDCRDNSFSPYGDSDEAVVFRCPESGYAVAQLDGNNLYIHHDICHEGTAEELAIYKELLSRVASHLKNSDEVTTDEAAKLMIETLSKNRDNTRDAFIELCLEDHSVSQILQEAKKRLERGESNAAALDEKLTAALSELRAAQESIAGINSAANEEAFGKEFDKLQKVPEVIGLEIKGDIMHVFTRMIRIHHKGKTYLIGKFRIEIPMHGKYQGLRFINLTNNGQGPGATQPGDFNANSEHNRHHPHVRSDGSACLGNIGEAMTRYIREYQFSVVTILAIQFLKNVNDGDPAGRGIFWWPEENQP